MSSVNKKIFLAAIPVLLIIVVVGVLIFSSDSKAKVTDVPAGVVGQNVQTAATVATTVPATETPTPAPTPTAQPTSTPEATVTPQPTVEPSPTAVPTPKSPGAVVPARLRIPNLGIDTQVEQVGVTKDGAMAVPNSFFTVGWYKLGAKPGEIGNAVVAGHYDNPKGPSIFWDLKKLQPGNKIFISDNSGKELTFEVYNSEYYPYDNAPLEKIFGGAKDIQLNLITCGGVFDTKSRNYNERLVVYTRLVQTP